MNSPVFFLGGLDAEMCEIRSILKEREQPFYDKNLSWGARLSDYKNEVRTLPNNVIPVFVELTIDLPLPEKAIVIDHHNEKAGTDKPTSIEQVAQLLGIKLNRRQQLIAANDRAHIKGMIHAGATPQKITEIRAFDRRCQGVTEDEEKQAESICACFRSKGKLDVMEIQFPHTSPITDRLFDQFQNLLVITPIAINFFGRGNIVKILSKKYKGSWYGGNLPQEGFWGIKRISQNQIDEIKSLLTSLV